VNEIVALLGEVYELIIRPIIGLLVGIAFIVFLWGVFEFIRGADNEETRRKGGRNMLWGLVGMFIMVSVFGILTVILGTIPEVADEPPRPTIPSP